MQTARVDKPARVVEDSLPVGRTGPSAAAPDLAPSKQRIVPIDAARGLAMLFSCLSHYSYWIEQTLPTQSWLLRNVGHVATPTFLLLSGMMAGLLCGGRKAGTRAVRVQLIDRGIFLATVGHLFIAFSEAHARGLAHSLFGASIVDEIGLALILVGLSAPALATLDMRRYAGIGAVIAFCATWVVALEWTPEGRGALEVKQALFGPNLVGDNVATYTAPTIQYLLVYLMGVGLSVLVSDRSRPLLGKSSAGGALAILGTALLAAAMLLRAVRYFLDAGMAPSAMRTFADFTLTIASKMPPSPVYLAFFGGFGCIAAGAFLLAWNRGMPAMMGLMNWLAVIGRASLFSFILQYSLLWTVPDLIGLPVNRLAPLVLIADIGILWLAAYAWGAMNGNRWFTVGLRRLSGA